MNSVSDWTLWRSFAAVAEHGSLSGAARALGVSQPTIGRHIEALEVGLGAKLFERSLAGFAPTELGLRAYEPVRQAAQALAEAELYAAGSSAVLEGAVRITASVVMSHYTLPPMLRRLRDEFPDIALEVVPTDSPENLLMREADIAVRMFRPTQLDLVTRKVGESPIVACAHESYVATHGVPATLDELRAHELLGFDRSEVLISAARALGFSLKRSDFAIRCDSQSALWEMAKAGLGIGFAQKTIINRTPGMVALDLPLAIPPLEVWLTSHRELYGARRIRVVYDRLAEMLSVWLRA
ncbi:LysR family transcriptional regulator [Pelagibacterium xiamenense]|uniref:LysR family transcriptional regulator n=1 Tax=Pelagibacterium xiamenense TaxID=2901140 RepID=UPI001E2CEEDC|nr:LysR family transcriptional regulator [Pelagibacterium xiamenense]MCD7061306.1 LysR family transcriptional regulator [Pelagibacterium xiamenense]